MPDAAFNSHPSWLEYREIVESEFGIGLPREISEHWQDIRGHSVRYDEWLPVSEPLGTVIMVHGAGGHGRLLAPFANEAARAGWRVICPDLPGYGLTEPAQGFDWSYGEWPLVVAELANQFDCPKALLGASMGGLTAVYAARDVDNLEAVIVTTLIDLSKPKTFALGSRWKALGWLSLLGMKTIPFVMDRVWLPLSLAAPLKAMSGNKRVQRYFQSDPLLGRRWLPVKFWRSVHDYSREEIALDCPLLLVHPGDDAWTPLSVSRETFARILAQKSEVVLTNGSHLPLEAPAFAELSEAVKAFLSGID